MREIKFRGRVPDKGWLYGDLRHIGNNLIYIVDKFGHGSSVNPSTVGQFTGLYDCEGREIYEGDVVAFGDFRKAHDIENEYWHGVVKWSFESARFVLDALDFDEDVCTDELLVIGNVHDNPRLLKVEHD